MTKNDSLPFFEDDNIEYIGRIRSHYASLSKKQKKIAAYILEHKEDVIHYSVTQLADKVGTVPSSITRFCQALSCRGFSELKVYIEKGLLSPVAGSEIPRDDRLSVVIQKMTNSAKDVLSDTQRVLNPNTVDKVVTAILNAGSINIYGQSGGHISALYFEQTLLRTGILSRTINDPLDMNLSACATGPNDVVIGIAYSGEAKSVLDAMDIARANRATAIAITATPNSSMAKLADHTLYYSHNIPDDLQYLHLGSICELSIIGSIQSEILRRVGNKGTIEACKRAVLGSRKK